MNTIFMKSENSETSDPHQLLLNRADKINLKRSDSTDKTDKTVIRKILSRTYELTWKHWK